MTVWARNFSGLMGALAIGLVLFFFPTHIQVTSAQSIGSHSGASQSEIRSSRTFSLYLPLVSKSFACPTLNSETYGTIAPLPPPTNPPAEINPDLNLSVRGYISTMAYLGLIDYSGGSDPYAPQLPGLFTDNRTVTFRAAYQVKCWDWDTCPKGTPIPDPPVTLAGLTVTPTETIRVPSTGTSIGNLPNGYAVMVLYASTNRITLTYTRNDSVANGYALHLESICVEPRLLALYQSSNAAGRTQLPALNTGQGIGTAMSNELGVAIRDSGSFMEPRSRKDWWQGR
jgi:hypothetical protein